MSFRLLNSAASASSIACRRPQLCLEHCLPPPLAPPDATPSTTCCRMPRIKLAAARWREPRPCRHDPGLRAAAMPSLRAAASSARASLCVAHISKDGFTFFFYPLCGNTATTMHGRTQPLVRWRVSISPTRSAISVRPLIVPSHFCAKSPRLLRDEAGEALSSARAASTCFTFRRPRHWVVGGASAACGTASWSLAPPMRNLEIMDKEKLFERMCKRMEIGDIDMWVLLTVFMLWERSYNFNQIENQSEFVLIFKYRKESFNSQNLERSHSVLSDSWTKCYLSHDKDVHFL
jgi:hypothetical protein